jgi:transmembrane sensor
LNLNNYIDLVEDSSFQRWVFGRATSEEHDFWKEWCSRNDRNRKMADQAIEELTMLGFSPMPLPSVDLEWEKLSHRINSEKSFGTLPLSTGRRRFMAIRIAAMLLLAGMLTLFIIRYLSPDSFDNALTHQFVYETESGEIADYTLPDGTRVVLNGNSRLVLDEKSESFRKAGIEGEVFFEIMADDANPYVISTGEGTVRVTGTSFSLYSRNGVSRLTLESGILTVTDRLDDEYEMRPGERIVWGDKQNTTVREVDVRLYTSWRNRLLVFDRTPLGEVVQSLSETHGIDAEVIPESLKDRRLTGSVPGASLEILLEGIATSLNISYSLEGNQLILYEPNAHKNQN